MARSMAQLDASRRQTTQAQHDEIRSWKESSVIARGLPAEEDQAEEEVAEPDKPFSFGWW